MSWFDFRIRNAERDRRTDGERFGRLRADVERLRREVERERDGLQARYEVSAGDAAFAQQAFENGLNDARLSGRIERLTRALVGYERRMHRLETQIAFIEEMTASLERAPFDRNPGGAGAADKPVPPLPGGSPRSPLPL